MIYSTITICLLQLNLKNISYCRSMEGASSVTLRLFVVLRSECVRNWMAVKCDLVRHFILALDVLYAFHS